ncbi:MAG: ABC-three component system protein [Thiotrichaceae bacterium]|nr:ABC-three component system protein [Thiotrichaceae bacterium]
MMGSKARNYSDSTLKRLFGLSGNQCAFPRCTKLMVNASNAKDSNICHIEAANEKGERYNPNMTDKQRADYENLILLCPQHHDETNNEEKYTVDVLKEMKRNHESKLLHEKIKSKPSMLNNAINAIAEISFDDIDEQDNLTVFDPKLKITHNAIKRNVVVIQEYKVYHHKINSLYDELELQGSIKKESLLRNIKMIYTEVKGSYVLDSQNELDVIRENSDNIIDGVYEKLYTKMEESDYWDEDIIFAIRLIMIDAFMRCKILEEPPKNDS